MELIKNTEPKPVELEFTIKMSKAEVDYLFALFSGISTAEANKFAKIDDETDIAYNTYHLLESMSKKF